MRREVRLTDEFFRDLEDQLPPERTHLPSQHDFAARELIPLVDAVAKGWDDLLPLFKGRDDYRELWRASDLGLVFRVECQLAPDGAIELVGLDIDTAPPWVSEAED